MPSMARNRSIGPFIVSPKSCFIPRKIAEAFFADVGDKGHGTVVLTFARFERANDRHQDGQPPAVVADARTRQDRPAPLDPDVRAFGKHRVEVRGDHDCGRAATPGRSPRTLPALSMRTLDRPSCSNDSFTALARALP